jgi:hypothetical protein
MGLDLRGDIHAFGDKRRAGSNTPLVDLHPAVLASAHQAEAGAAPAAELKSAKAAALREDCGKHGIPGQTFDGHSIDREADGAAVASGHADKL